jgi:large subunit ribosomal protein L4
VEAKIYNLAGEEAGSIELDDAIFGVTPNLAVIQQAVLRQQANARQGTHETKTRAEVRGGGRKPWRQKGTGRARQGSTRSPQWTHGGVVFGPHVRSYEQAMPRKMRRLAVRGVLSSKLSDGRLVLVEDFADIEPRTKTMVDLLSKLNVGTESALIMFAADVDNLKRAAGNLPRVTLQHVSYLNIVDMLKHEFIIMPRASVEIVQAILGSQGGRRKLSLTRDGNGTATAETPAKAEKKTPAKAEKATPAKAEAADTPKKRSKKSEAAVEAGAEDNVTFEPTAKVAKKAEATTSEQTEEKEARPKAKAEAKTDIKANADDEAGVETRAEKPEKKTRATKKGGDE